MIYKNILLFMFLWFLINTNIVARDATDIEQVIINPTTVSTRADEAMIIATQASNTVSTIEVIANNAQAIAQGTVNSLINTSGCVYDITFPCTETNLTHSYQTISFTTSGNHTWTVPNNITQIYVVVKGSDGESALSYQCYVYGIDGQSSQIAINNTTISALGGTGSRGYRYKGECINQSAATTGQIKTSYINVIAGQTGSITIGTINAYVTIKY